MGFKLSGKGNLILAATDDEASFKATLKWTKEEADADRAASLRSFRKRNRCARRRNVLVQMLESVTSDCVDSARS